MTQINVHGEGPSESAAGKGFIHGSIAGFIAVSLIGFFVALNAGAELWPAIGVAAFAGVWGGPGFGGMIGATLAALRHDDDQKKSSRIEA